MNESLFDTEKVVKHWIESSEKDFKVMNILFKEKSYDWALFIGHISVEKLLKAYYVKIHNTNAPFTHNLYRLAQLSNIELTDEYSDWLDQITTFNIEARYDDFKKEFYSLCTFEYTQNWIYKIEVILKWLKQML